MILDRGKIVEHRKVAELVARTSCLTFRLEADAPAGLVAKLSAVPTGDARRAGPSGRAQAGGSLPRRRGGRPRNKTQIAVLQALAAAGVGMMEMSRGQSLQDKVIEITRPSTA